MESGMSKDVDSQESGVEGKSEKETSSDQNTSCAKLELQLFEEKVETPKVDVPNVPKQTNKKDQNLPPKVDQPAAQNNYILEQRHAKTTSGEENNVFHQKDSVDKSQIPERDRKEHVIKSSIVEDFPTTSMKQKSPQIRVVSKDKFVKFDPMTRDLDYEMLFNKAKNDENTIETVRKSRSKSCNFYNTNVIPVDWLGIPLSSSTLPDFKSTTKKDFKIPDPFDVKEIRPQSVKSARSSVRTSYDQFSNLQWIPQDLIPKGLGNGHKGKRGQMSTLIPHPKSSIWNVPETYVNKIKRSDPMEYLNLLDPNNKISTEKAMYDWILHDEGEIGHTVAIGNSVMSSGFANNRLPHLPLTEERDFHSIYKKSYCTKPIQNDIEGLAIPQSKTLEYPGYKGATNTMRDVPFSFIKFAPNVIKTNPDILKQRKTIYSRAMSARPIP